jgi:hypothetical protein
MLYALSADWPGVRLLSMNSDFHRGSLQATD